MSAAKQSAKAKEGPLCNTCELNLGEVRRGNRRMVLCLALGNPVNPQRGRCPSYKPKASRFTCRDCEDAGRCEVFGHLLQAMAWLHVKLLRQPLNVRERARRVEEQVYELVAGVCRGA